MNDALAREAAKAQVDQLADTLRRRANSRFTPPIGGPAAPLADLLIHDGDMRVPLGLPHDPAIDETETALDLIMGRNAALAPRRRTRGIRLVPADSERRWGSGAELHGRTADLMMALAGRRALLEALSGPGTYVLADRL